jgi:hypothetical protein
MEIYNLTSDPSYFAFIYYCTDYYYLFNYSSRPLSPEEMKACQFELKAIAKLSRIPCIPPPT